MAALWMVTPLLAMPQPAPEPQSVPEKRPATGALPASALPASGLPASGLPAVSLPAGGLPAGGLPAGGRGLLKGEGGAMHAWCCGHVEKAGLGRPALPKRLIAVAGRSLGQPGVWR